MLRPFLSRHPMAAPGLILSACLALGGCQSADETANPPQPAKGAPPTWRVQGIRHVSVPDEFFQCRWQSCSDELKDWSRRTSCEKLAFAECLLACVPGAEDCPSEGYRWKRGTDDLSLPDAWTKWALTVVLGVKLRGVVDRGTTPEDIKRLRENARLAVEAFRQGVIASAADNELQPADFARLRQKYFGKIPWGPWPSDSGVDPRNLGMDDFLLEWPPIGRKYEDLVSLIGVKGRPTRDPTKRVVFYSFSCVPIEYRYYFVLRDGVICSVRAIGF